MLNAVSMFTPIFPLVLLRLCPLKVSRISVFHWSTFWWEYHVRRPLSYVNLLPHDVHLNICLPLPAEYNGPVEPVDRTTLSHPPIHTEPSTDSD